MAADTEPPSYEESQASVAAGSTEKPPSAATATQPNSSRASAESAQVDGTHTLGTDEADPNGGNANGENVDNKKRKNDKKDQKQNEWREWKRRKTDKLGNSFEREAKNPFSKEEIAADVRRPKRKVAVMVGYAGTGYRGMQLNGDDKTIERDIFNAFIEAGAISKANADDARKSSLSRCARTDKGVHAAGNVISLKLIIEDEKVLEKINAALPDQIRVWGIQRTNNNYNCYQYCDSRWYEYLLPSYSLLPPHPNSFMGQKLVELTKEYGAEEDVSSRLEDVKGFWENVDDTEVKAILARLEPEVRAVVLEKLHAHDDDASKETTDDKKDEKSNVKETEGAPKPEASSDAADRKSDAVTLETHKPKSRELSAVDYALRDIKATYITAKRRYRISEARLQQLQAILDLYKGTHNFHNYTVQKPFSDPSAKRLIKSFVVNPKPIIINNTEWLSLKVHGQSFMMHQIRKMVGLASLMVRCGTPLSRISESYQKTRMAIPKAPGLGLLLEKPVFENYNRRARESLGRPEIDFSNYEAEMDAFKHKEIYTRIFEVEEKENWFHSFYNQIDQFRANHFLWLTAGGMAVADFNKGNEAALEKTLDDEDENPEGGDG